MLNTTEFSKSRYIEEMFPGDDRMEGDTELSVMTVAAHQRLLVEWNKTQQPYPKGQSISRLFEVQVARTPGAVALIYEGRKLTFAELNEQANALAHYLRRIGVGPDVRVGLCVERSPEMVIGLLGILKAGGAYLPLDPSYPQNRLAFMLGDADTAVLITQQSMLKKLPAHKNVICLDAMWQVITQESKENLPDTVSGEDLSYIIYTSGSSGQPKGVLGTHRAAINRFHWMWTTYPFEAGEVCCQKTALSFVDSVWEVFGPLLRGVRVIIIPDMAVKDPRHLVHMLAIHGVTRIVLVPSLLRAMLETTNDLKAVLPRLKYCVSSGEALPLELALRFVKAMPHCTLLNLYGSSEVAADATCYDMRNWNAGSLTSIPIGRPIANTQIYLLDERMRPVSIGSSGEIYVGGDGLARGYFNRPDLTAVRFVDNPFVPGMKLYKTGDWGRYLRDGNIEYLGRQDQQVKIRGFRIELGEIETVLVEHPSVNQAVVVAHDVKGTSGDKRLVAYVVLHKGPTHTNVDLRGYATKKFPSYMVPSTFVQLESFPLTPNGKVDRLALPAPESVRPPTEESFVAPTSMVAHRLKQIWEELLDVRPIGMRDNFFHIGGHSLLAAKLVARIEQELGKRISLETLFAAPTIEQLVLAMQTEQEKSSRIPLVPVQASGSKAPFFYLHGAWDSDAFYCFQLSKRLGPDQPFYALPPYDFTGLQVAPSIEEMATAHIQSIRTVQPQGPYLLGGFCNGGLIAYEMARQLVMQGEKIECLVLVVPAYPTRLHTLTHQVIKGLGTLLTWSKEQELEYFLRFRHVYKYIRGQRKSGNLKGFRNIDPTIFTLKPTTYALLQDDNAILDWTIAEYDYPHYVGDIELIWAREESFHTIWRRKAAQEEGTRLHIVPGSHIGCRTDHIQTLSETVAQCIEGVYSANTVDSVQTDGFIESRYGANISV